MIHVQDFHKNYDQTVAVAGLTFDVQGGQILGLLGPNGAGKTTTMRAIAGITPPTQGHLIVAGHDVAKEPVEAKRNLSYVPDDPKLFDALTVEEHLEFTASAYDVRDYKPFAEQLMAQFELTEQRRKLAQELSRGMRQKVAICCAYLHSPRAILVDEPLTGLDPRGIRTMNQSLREQAARGTAVVISSHLLALVEDLCTHLLILHRGRSLYFGPTETARAAFAGGDTSLEDVFFRVTEGDGVPQPAGRATMIIHHSLWKLLAMLMRARVRWMFRGGRSGRSITFLTFGFLVVGMALLGAIFRHYKFGRVDPSAVTVYLPVVLLTFCIANLISAAGERAIAFTPAETDFLFPGPFTRRELLIYKILKGIGAAAISAAVFGTFFWNYAPAWIASYMACFLSLVFLQLLSIAIMLLALNVTERVLNRVRRFALGAIVVVLAFAAEPIIAAARTRDPVRIAQGLKQSVAVRVLLAPFEVFARIIAAPEVWPGAWVWIGIAIAMIVGLLVAVLLLDAQYMEAATTASRRRYEMVRQARKSGIAMRATSSRLRAPALPRMGGVGPIAWRQLTTAVRQSRGLLTLLVMIGIGAGIFVFTQRDDGNTIRPTAGVIMWASVMLANSLRFDFRGDIDLIDSLKALPLPPLTICAGEIVAPAIVMSLFHLSIIAMAMIAGSAHTGYLIAAATLILPVNFVMFAVENLMFLLFPTRFATAAPGDLQGSGRMIFVMFLKVFVVGLAIMAAVGIGAIIHTITDNWIAGVASTGVILIVELIALLTVMSYAFVRFDPQMHTPA